MSFVNLEELSTKSEALRREIIEKHNVYFNKPNGKFKVVMGGNEVNLSVADLEEILKAAKQFEKMDMLKRLHEDLVKEEKN